MNNNVVTLTSLHTFGLAPALRRAETMARSFLQQAITSAVLELCIYIIYIYKCKNEIRCKDDTVPKNVRAIPT